MVSGLFLGLIVLMKFFRSMPIICRLHDILVVKPAAWLDRAERRHLILAAIAVTMLILSTEMLIVFGSVDALLAFSFDLSIYLDAAILVASLAAVNRAKIISRAFAHRFVTICRPAIRKKPNAKREVRPRSVRKDNDDESRSMISLAA